MTLSRKEKEKLNQQFHQANRKKQMAVSIVFGVIGVAVLVGVLFYCLLGVTTVSGNSMVPTYSDGQNVVFQRVGYTLQRGDVIGIKMTNGDSYIKRVVAVEGDTVEMVDGVFYRNGEADLTYGTGLTEPQDPNIHYPLTVQEGEVFVLGDNRENSIDSRTFGPVANAQITGKIFD